MANAVDPGCFFHGEEPIPDNCYRICLECGHAWLEDELISEHNRVMAEIAEHPLPLFPGEEPLPFTPETDPDKIFSCPLCIHDF